MICGNRTTVTEREILIVFHNAVVVEIGHGDVGCTAAHSASGDRRPAAGGSTSNRNLFRDSAYIARSLLDSTGRSVRLIYWTWESRRRRRRVKMIELPQSARHSSTGR